MQETRNVISACLNVVNEVKLSIDGNFITNPLHLLFRNLRRHIAIADNTQLDGSIPMRYPVNQD